VKRRGFLMLGGLAVAGCGGGAPQVTRETRLKLDIVWPERTRSLSAPSGALSAVASVESLGGGTSTFQAIDRETSLSGYTQNWTSLTGCPTGIVRLSVRFFAGRGGLGSLVGTAAKTVVIAADGTGAGTIAVEGKIDSIAVTGQASLRVADNATYNITARDAAGTTIAVEPGAASFTVGSGTTALSIAANGVSTGLSVGSATVVATLGEKQSPAFAVNVTPPSGARAVIAAGQSVDVGESKKLVASVTDAQGNAITVDPSLISYTVTAGADRLEITNDGTMTGKSVGTATVRFVAGELSTTGTVAIAANVLATVDPFQTVLPGNTITLTARVTDRGGAPITPPGSLTWTQVTGDSVLSLTANGEARGLAVGISTVRTTVVGISSPVQTVLIGDVRVSGTGLRSFEETIGTGATAQAGGTITAHYTGWLLDGTKFDSSRDRGQPATFSLNRVIDGWKEGIPGMKVGGRRFLVIPPELGYGNTGSGSVPPNATLVFDVELVSVP
jgi:hypothetical protein